MTMFNRFFANEQNTFASCVRSENGSVSACASFARYASASVCAAEYVASMIMGAAIQAASIIFIIIRAIIIRAIIMLHFSAPNVWTSVQTA